MSIVRLLSQKKIENNARGTVKRPDTDSDQPFSARGSRTIQDHIVLYQQYQTDCFKLHNDDHDHTRLWFGNNALQNSGDKLLCTRYGKSSAQKVDMNVTNIRLRGTHIEHLEVEVCKDNLKV
jgi:hypothetical protein